MKRTRRSRRKLAFLSALPPYLGGKRRLAPIVFREIDRLIPRRLWPSLTLLDCFMGGASMALFAKAQAFGKVIGTDLALRSVTIGQALVANSRVRLTEADVVRVLAPHDGPPGPVEREMVPSVFLKAQARAIDNALAIAAQTEDVAKAALLRLLAMRLALLAHPYSQIRKGTIHRMATGEFESITPSAAYHYVDGWKLATVPRLWEIAQQINQGVFEGRGEVRQTDILEALPTIEADVMYADPPYEAVMSYEKQYEVLDRILERVKRPTSPFTVKGGAQHIDTLLERAKHVPVWVLSFGNAARSLEELEAKMIRLGRQTKAIAIKYQHLPAVATEEKNEINREFLVVGWDADAELFQGARSKDRLGQDEVRHVRAGVEVNANLSSAEGPTT